VTTYFPAAQAAIGSCEVSVTPHQVESGASVNFSFSLRNTDSADIVWIQVLRANSGYLINEATATGWSAQTNSSSATFSGGALSGGGNTLDFQLNVQTPNPGNPPGSWTTLVSDQPNGSSPFSCDGDQSVSLEITRDTTPPVISNIKLTSLASTSVTISWKTDEPTAGSVHYGESADYDQESDLEQDLVSDHSMPISGLTPNTGYNFSIEADDEAGNASFSPDNTFLTPAPGSSSANLTIPTGGLTNTILPITPGKESVPPTISITTVISGVYKQAPQLVGVAGDNDTLVKIEYSIDGGVNWSSVDTAPGLGTKKSTFSFTPRVSEDGNFDVLARAIDEALNITLSKTQTLVVDTQPPVVGVLLINNGPQLFYPNSNGVLTGVRGVDQNITTNAVGGPIEITIKATTADEKVNQQFSLTRSTESGLWSGIVSFSQSGNYQLSVDALDGAGNRTNRSLGSAHVVDSPQVVDARTNEPITGATVKLFAEDQISHQWELWDGSAYSEKNSQLTDASGRFEFLLPPGRYYLNVSQSRYRNLTSQILTVDRASPFVGTIKLKKKVGFSVGRVGLYLPGWSTSSVEIASSQDNSSGDEAKQTVTMPNFNLPTTSGGSVSPVDLLGKPTVVSIINSWSPPSSEQLANLDRLSANDTVNVIPILGLESLTLATLKRQIGGYSVAIAADHDGQLISRLDLNAGPVSYFINQRGIVTKVVSGVVSVSEMEDYLSQL